MARFSAILALIAAVSAIPSPLTPDPNGDHLVGNAQGEQFITGGCLSTADCSQATVHSCCAFISGGAATGICSGFDVANVNGKAGCGFGDGGAAASSSAAVAATSAAAVAAPAASASVSASASSGTCTVNTALSGSANVGTGAGTQFITGQCFSAADCASGCCVAQADGTNLCKAELVTTEAGLSCDASCTPSTTAVANRAASVSSGTCSVNTALSGSANVGTGAGTQFITGQCFSAADCASGCCVAQADGTNLCKAELVTTEAGLSCNATCDNAASTDTPAATTSAAAAAPPAATSAAASGTAGSAQCTVDTSLAGSESVGTGAGTQFITGQCLSKADCASGCCVAQASGVALCKAELLTTQSGLSCDFSCAA